MKTLIAIDPGASGGIAFSYGGIVDAIPFSGDLKETVDAVKQAVWQCRQVGVPLAVIEAVGGHMGGRIDTGASMFVFGENTGWVKGALEALRVPIYEVRSQEWQKELKLNGLKNKRKRDIKEMAKESFPELKVTLKTSDALMLLKYALRVGY